MTIARNLCFLAASASLALAGASPARAQASDPLIGQLMTFAGDFCPRNWTKAEGQLLAISQYQALFSILGTNFGGDGQTTFALPDLRGRVVIAPGYGPGLSPRQTGERGGMETVVLTLPEMPNHTHSAMLRAADQPASEDNPTGHYLADFPDAQSIYGTGPANAIMGNGSIVLSTSGGSQPHPNMQPFLTITTCIALRGIFPTRG